jgi:hypothetical protein
VERDWKDVTACSLVQSFCHKLFALAEIINGDSILMQGRPEVWDESMCGASANQQNAAADASLDPDL